MKHEATLRIEERPVRDQQRTCRAVGKHAVLYLRTPRARRALHRFG